MEDKSHAAQQPACLRLGAAGFFLVMLLCLAGCGSTATPTPDNPTPNTPTSAPALAVTNTPIPASATSTPIPATATGTPLAPTATSTMLPPTLTPTLTSIATTTHTNTPVQIATATSTPHPAPANNTPTRTAQAANIHPTATATRSPVIISIVDFYFSPKVVTVTVGTKIVWINVGPTEHTVADDSLKLFSSDILNAGQGYEFTPTKPGKIPYLCTLHPDMVGTIIVK